MLRYLNMFVLIGIALVGISLAGFATHNRFLLEPGQKEDPWISFIYLGAGVLMLINGAVSIRHAPPRPVPPPKKEPGDANKPDKPASAPTPEETY